MTFFENLLAATLSIQTPEALERAGYNLICEDVIATVEKIDEDTSYAMAKKVNPEEYRGVTNYFAALNEDAQNGMPIRASEIRLMISAMDEIFYHGDDHFMLIFSDNLDNATLYFVPEKKFVYGLKIKDYMKKACD